MRHCNSSSLSTKCIARFLFIFSSIFLVQLNLSGQKPQKYNVLFIAVDDLNDWVEPLKGYPGVKTPNIDRLAKKGMTFKKAYCSAPACNPSRASLLTGVRPSTSGVYHNTQPWRNILPNAVTLPQYFTANGYKVMGAGKIFHEPFEDSASWPVKYEVPDFPRPAKTPVNGGANFDTERWRYISYNDGGEELYHHNADPEEWKNLPNDPKYNSIKTSWQSGFQK